MDADIAPSIAQAARAELNAHVMSRCFEPLRAYVQGGGWRGFGESADLVNGFFASRLDKPDYLLQWRESGLPLRRWLMNGLLLHLHERARAERRMLRRAEPCDPGPLERVAGAMDHAPEAERAMDRAWADAVVQAAVRDTVQALEQSGRAQAWATFRRHFVEGAAHDAIARETGVSVKELKAHAKLVQRVRASSSCNTQGAPKFGDFFVDLLDAGEIRQAIATTPGKSYRLTFWLSGDCAGGPATKRVTASLGSATQTFDHACVGSAVQAWRSCTLEFIANSAITNLSLKSLAGGSSNGPLVDGVRVEDISISCAGDVDGDGEVTGSDIGLVLLNFGPCPQ